MNYQEFQFITRDGKTLHGKAWIPQEIRAVICLVHGLGEHSGRYTQLAEHLNLHGYALYGYDQRGHGKSEGTRGHARQEDLWDDVETIMKTARAEHLDLPLVLYGHSWGGNVVANFLLRRRVTEVKAAILSSPWLNLSFEPPAWKIRLGKMVAGIWPSLTQSNSLQAMDLSRDQAVVNDYQNDPLVHDRISAGLFIDTQKSGLFALAHSEKLRTPTLVMHGSDDRITSSEASQAFASGSDLADFKLWPDYRHEPHNDLGREVVMDYLTEWLEQRLFV